MSGKSTGFTTLLVFPPQWTPQNPHYVLTGLGGHLRSKGHAVILKDLNVEFYDDILTPEYLGQSLRKIAMNHQHLVSKRMLAPLVGSTASAIHRIEKMKLERLKEFQEKELKNSDAVIRGVLDAKETFRDRRRFYNPQYLIEAFSIIDRALEIVSLPYYPAKLTFSGFDQPHCLFATHSLIVHAKTPGLNMFYHYFRQKLPELMKPEPSLVAISINSFSQVLPGLTLAMMMKSGLPPGSLVAIGGNFFTRVKDALLKRPEFFENFADVVALGEGEKTMEHLVACRQEGKSLAKVPSILYHKDGKVRHSFEEQPEKLDSLGFQDYEGLPLKKYFTPELVCCIQSSKGCYWGKCTFCDSDFGVHKDVKSLDRLVAEIKHLSGRFGILHYEFIDESIKPVTMKAMAERFIDEKLEIRWFSNGRLEEAFDGPLLERLHQSGITMILWGFESGCERILELINKGVDAVKRYEVLKNSSEASIWNFAYLFFGFPTETEEEAMETIRAICDHKDIIHSYGRSVFTLGRHSLLYLDAEKYGIFDVTEEGEELSTFTTYRSRGGMESDEIHALMKRCTSICAASYGYTLWYYLRLRENIHLYLARHGLEYVRDFSLEAPRGTEVEAW
ncbi:MAG: radical SAM protein [Candidatus Eremiobacteraeota bacterium]|nr:radical SAM protein [Candidatus Eremiobacteraeota bacterium]